MNSELPLDGPVTPSAEQASLPIRTKRLMSLDALRGFDMFWIVGGDALVESLKKVSDLAPIQELGRQMEHAAWQGFHFEDLIFPMFVFIVGASLVFSLGRTIEQFGASRRCSALFAGPCSFICWASFTTEASRDRSKESASWVCCSGSPSAISSRD